MKWRSWLVLSLGLGICIPAEAQSRRRPPPNYRQWGEPDQAKGREILEGFRESAAPTGVFLEFALRTYGKDRPREEVEGRLLAGRSPEGPASLIEVSRAGGGTETVRLLVQNGPAPIVYRSSEDGTVTEVLTGEMLSKPLFRTDVTPFDLQLPYLYWEDFVYEGLTRFRGRPTYVFILYPPADERELYPGISGVRLYLDSQFSAMVEAEILDEELEVRKRISLLEIKKVDGVWLAKTIDIRAADGRKTRFQLLAASAGNHWGPDRFVPANLLVDLPVVPEPDLIRVR